MARKPVVACVAGSSWHDFTGGEKPFWDAFVYVLREDYAYDVKNFSCAQHLFESWPEIESLAQTGLLALFILKEDCYYDQVTVTVSRIRERLAAPLPVVVIPEDRYGDERFQPDPSDPLLYVLEHEEIRFKNLLRDIAASWIPPLNRLGADSPSEQALLYSQLLQAYRNSYLVGDREDTVLGVPDVNGQVVAEALRIDQTPTSLLRAEFDTVLDPYDHPVLVADSSIYLEESRRIRYFSDAERERFVNILYRMRGQEVEGDIVRVVSVSCGEQVNGFAIDPATLEYLITTRFSEHHLAKQKLASRIVWIGKMREQFTRERMFETDLQNQIIKGLVFRDVEGFQTPVVQLHLYDSCFEQEDLERVVAFLRERRMFIPVTYDGELIRAGEE